MATKTHPLEGVLRRRVKGEVRFDPYSRAMYSTDASLYQMEPVGVVIPRDEEDVIAVVESCAEAGVPVLPRGAGTSLAGQTVNHAVVLDFSKYLHHVLEVSPEERWARVQPGITLDAVNQAVGQYGLHYPPDPTTTSRATVGGGIGNNSCGAHSIVYGKTSDHVKEIQVVLSNGQATVFRPLEGEALEKKLAKQGLEGSIYANVLRIVQEQREEIQRRFPKVMRRVSGYSLDAFLKPGPVDMTKLVVGSEGTLVVVTEAKLNLEPLPKMQAVGVLHFRDLLESMEATVATLEHRPAAVELVDKTIIRQARMLPGFARRMTFLEGEPEAVLVVEFFGDSEAELRARLDRLEEDMQRRRLGYACVRAMGPAQQADVWAVRNNGLGLLMSVKGDAKPLPFVEDSSVPPERLPEYVRRFGQIVQDHGTSAAYYAHASVGCLHIRPVINVKTQEGVERLKSISAAVSDLVKELGGSLSGEHGDGISRGMWMEKMFGTPLYNAFREVKRTFDPKGTMNPGKIVDCPPIEKYLRIGPNYRAMEVKTVFDFTADGGYARSVELCNGVGACRKLSNGTMCPSYMATREEEHSTRGRANVLRSVLSGLLPASEFASKRLYEVLDLCLECKGCKGECPSNVDMAKLKYEFLHKYYQAHRRPLRALLFAHVNTLNRWRGRLGPLANLGTGDPVSRWLLHTLLGIHRNRRLPPIAATTFPEWFRRRNGAARPAGAIRGQVVLFHDTFTDYHQPQVGIATTELLEAAGYEVVLADQVCCGRPMISKGMLEQAQEHARINVARLHAYARQGIPIVGCEPSCLLALRDDYLDLLPGSEEARSVAASTFLLDEFLVKLHRDGQLTLRFRETPGRLLFHGHCHQKALVGTAASLAALRLIPGLQVEEVNSGCCGMAGAFGYEQEHYDISMKIGEERLFPAVRSAPEARVAVTGFSCRHQIEDGTGRKALHVAEVLREALG
ncbi:MAG: anaerobic glycerol-3-phosphate dehydrogenase subunit C [Chloroflexi bacterium]|nr:anaerobic glycerol-3-phosphate dehydrogenase subunit C [Chloroflexota bacterium]